MLPVQVVTAPRVTHAHSYCLHNTEQEVTLLLQQCKSYTCPKCVILISPLIAVLLGIVLYKTCLFLN